MSQPPRSSTTSRTPRATTAPHATPPSVARDLSAPGAILLVATYELGHQPLTLAAPLALLRAAGYAPVARDTSIEEVSAEEIRAARLVAISTPMHTALRLGMPLAARVRALNPGATIFFYGLYAALNADALLKGAADAVAGGEYQNALLALARGDDPTTIPRPADATTVASKRGMTIAPDRAGLPGLERYARLARGRDLRLAGYVETTRGCLHTCLHCPITPVYGGQFYVNPRESVLADIRQQVAAGAEHITFGDPDFFNGPGHSMAIARALHAEFPAVTFDVTIKVEHILERRALVPELAALGCAFVVSAVESLSPAVLARLAKGHTAADVAEALATLDAAGIPMRPTFVAFTPWTSASDYLQVMDFIAAHDIVAHVDPIQYAIRLLVPPGSALLSLDDAADWFGPLDPATLSHTWAHPDPRMDALQREVMALVERHAAAHIPIRRTFAAIHRLAIRRLRPGASALDAAHTMRAQRGGPRRRTRPVPHLTEAWFC